MPANPRAEGPGAGSALPAPDRDIRELFDIAIAGDRLARHTGNSFMLSLEKVAAFCRCSRSEAVPIVRKIRRSMDEAEAAIETALADATPSAQATATGDEAPRDVVALIGDLRAVNGEQAPYANWKVRGWCHEAADRIADLLLERDEARAALASAEADDGWRPIGEAKKDRTPYLLKLKNPIPRDHDDLRLWDGLCFVGRHLGLSDDGFDPGWQFAAPVGHGGFLDEWFDGFRPIAPPASASTDRERKDALTVLRQVEWAGERGGRKVCCGCGAYARQVGFFFPPPPMGVHNADCPIDAVLRSLR